MFNLLETLSYSRRAPCVEHGPSWKTHREVRLSLESLEVHCAAPIITEALEGSAGRGRTEVQMDSAGIQLLHPPS